VDGHPASVLVRDHGIGINAEPAHLHFTRLGRLVTPETSHIRGTGLGRYTTRETARVHGGDIIVSTPQGGGSSFTVTLPIEQAETKSPPAPWVVAAGWARGRGWVRRSA